MSTQLTIRSIHENELESWFDHVGEIFKVGRTYFVRHWEDDPHKDLDGIFVALDGPLIVSTVRVFKRELFLNGSKWRMGGIGEVSTKPAYRKQGLATKLLTLALEYMNKQGYKISTLHGDQKIYSILGWNQVARIEKNVEISNLEKLKNLPYKITSTTYAKLLPIHQSQVRLAYEAKSIQLNGAVVRNDQYWSNWVEAECTKPQTITKFWIITDNKDDFVAYLILKGGTQTKTEIESEFITAESYKGKEKELFEWSLESTLPSYGLEKIEFKYSALLGEIFEGKYKSLEERNNYCMYQTLSACSPEERDFLTQFYDKPNNHVWWTIDDF